MIKKRYILPDQSVIRLNQKDLETVMKMQKEIYSEPFIEKEEDVKKILNNDLLNMGVVMDQKLVGFLLVTKDYVEVDNGIWLYDLAVLPEYQKRGLGSFLLSDFLQKTREEKMCVFAYCRTTSYSLFSNQKKLEKMGYKIFKDDFIKDGYFEECGVHEDLYEIGIEPIS